MYITLLKFKDEDNYVSIFYKNFFFKKWKTMNGGIKIYVNR